MSKYFRKKSSNSGNEVKQSTGLIFLIGEEVKEEVKDAVADEPEVEDVPQENDNEPSYDEDDEQLKDEDDAEE